jgi:hypothetical protein
MANFNKFNVCIIGAGAAGITIAKSMCSDNIKIAIIEKGPLNSNTVLNDYLVDSNNLPIRKNSRNIGFGGTTNSWASLSSLYEPDCINDGSFLWGINYEDITKYYKMASEIFPFPAYKNFIHNENYQNLNKYELKAKVFAGSGSRINFRDNLNGLADCNVDIFHNSIAYKLNLDKSNNAIESCDYFDEMNIRKKLFADVFICTSGGIENSLLLSRSSISTNSPVGRYFMDHYKFRSGVFQINNHKKFTNYFGKVKLGMPIYFGITNSKSINKLNPYIRIEPIYPWSEGTALNSFISIIKPVKGLFTKASYLLRFNANVIGADEYYEDRDFNQEINYVSKILDVLKNAHIILLYILKRIFPFTPVYPSKGQIFNHLDMEARFDNIIVDKSYHDDLKKFKQHSEAKISFKNELNTINKLHAKFATFLEHENLGVYYPDENQLKKEILNNIQDASHHMGTTRIGQSSKDSVVDTNLKVHDVENLYVSGSSVFRNGQNSNPTYTIVALSLRLSDYLVKKYFKINHEQD